MQLDIDKILKEHNLKSTKVRRDILELFSTADAPIDAVFLTNSLKVNKTTVYRELKTLLDKGLIIEIEFGDGKKRYELSCLDHHHHLVCVKCKSVNDITLNDELKNEEKLIERKTSFKVLRHSLEFFGLCAKCQ